MNSIQCATCGYWVHVWEYGEVWQEWHMVLCAKCAEVKGERQLRSFALNMLDCVGEFAYLGDMLNDTGGVHQAVATRVREHG